MSNFLDALSPTLPKLPATEFATKKGLMFNIISLTNRVRGPHCKLVFPIRFVGNPILDLKNGIKHKAVVIYILPSFLVWRLDLTRCTLFLPLISKGDVLVCHERISSK